MVTASLFVVFHPQTYALIPLVLLVEQSPHTDSLSLKPSSSAKKEAGCGSRLRVRPLCNRLDHYQENRVPPAENRNGESESKFFFLCFLN